MTVNGQAIPLQNAVSLSEFLKREGYDARKVAVEKNGSIVPRKDFDTEMLADADKLEVVHFVGGG
jgi:thiamine biosynthesis protein ThiS